MIQSEQLWQMVLRERNGILATIDDDGRPHLSNIYYLSDPDTQVIRFSTTSDRIKGHNLLRDPRATLHISGPDFFNFAVVTGSATLYVPEHADDAAVHALFEIHSGLGAASLRAGFGEDMLTSHRMAVWLRVERIYGQILDRPSGRT
jgi:PPOX class probable F420-dependent enzyme